MTGKEQRVRKGKLTYSAQGRQVSRQVKSNEIQTFFIMAVISEALKEHRDRFYFLSHFFVKGRAEFPGDGLSHQRFTLPLRQITWIHPLSLIIQINP